MSRLPDTGVHLSRSSRRRESSAGRTLRVASYGRRWYLIAWDLSRSDWRTFRVDRIVARPITGAVFAARTQPADVAAHIERGIAYAPFACRVTLRLRGVRLSSRPASPPGAGSSNRTAHATACCESGPTASKRWSLSSRWWGRMRS
ncbi:helix-turn-helix transcriptional regulator [Nannocystis pusilla]|uniref:helix-turn-helix transcriptional regulator n=1 Tax=Nannocystis pusilla TaxID=889268 RepID=UPI003B760398